MARRVLTWVVIAGSLATGTLALPAGATSLAQSTTCDANLTVLFRPGLTLTQQSQQIKATGTLSNCAGGSVTSANGIGTGSGSLSCTSGTATATLKLRWDTAELSKISASVDIGAGTFTGTVVAGKFAGEAVSGDLTLTPLQGDCIFTPVTKASATGPVSI